VACSYQDEINLDECKFLPKENRTKMYGTIMRISTNGGKHFGVCMSMGPKNGSKHELRASVFQILLC
jgi:hypothetical protein